MRKLLLFSPIGGLAILFLLLGKKYFKSFPASLAAVITGVLIVSIFSLDQNGVGIVGSIPSNLPYFSLPSLSWENFQNMAPLALTIAVIAFMESYSVSKAIESKRGDHVVRPNQELFALGMSNVVGSLFQSYPVTGGFSRSAVNEQAGARTPLASIISAGLVTVVLVFLTPYFYHLPKAILAAVIIVAVVGLIDVRFIGKLFRESKVEFGLLMATFGLTIFLGMVEGIVGGIVLSILVLLYRAAYPHIAILGKVEGNQEYRNIKRFDNLKTWPHVVILRLDAPLTFINIHICFPTKSK